MTLKVDADGQNVDVTINGGPVQRTLLSASPTFSITGGSGDDLVTVDFSAGDPLPTSGLTYGGGAGGSDAVAFIGTSGDDTLSIVSSGVSFSAAGAAAVPVNLTGVGAIRFGGGSGADNVVASYGHYTLDATTPVGTPNVSVAVSGGAAVTLASDQRLAGVTINGGSVGLSSATTLTVAGPLSITGGGTLDLGAGELMLDASSTSLSTVRTYIQAAYDGGKWDGAGGITCGAVAANPIHYAIGYAAAGQPNVVATIPAGSILVRPTMFGDTNLDGTVTNADISAMIAGGHYLDGSTSNSWAVGDWNYDGKVDNYDVSNLIASGNYLSGQTYTPPAVAPAASPAVETLASAIVPNAAPAAAPTAALMNETRPQRSLRPTTPTYAAASPQAMP